jgi:hypothetical protein
VTKSARIQIVEIVLHMVSILYDRLIVQLTCLTITNDSDIGQALNLIMLSELECDLLTPFMILSIISANHCRVTRAHNGQFGAKRRERKIEHLLQSCPEPILLT